uniref:Reverse transcriptase domain-containing protein n=1 Tax=Podarcis muralis TaxID=64176 RepID=A0A670ICM2_PODMU
MALKIWNWNVNGMNNKKKRNGIEHILKKKNLDIICLQETHVAKKHRKVLINKRLGNEFISSDKEKKRGVALYIKSKIESHQLFKDEEGRMIAAQIIWQGEKMIIVGIYAPNGNKTEFFRSLEEKLFEYMDQKIIVMGDMNGVVSLELDRLRKTKNKEGKLPKTFFTMMKNYNLVDIWRLRNPLEKQFTYHSEPNQSFSRIDQIWVSNELTLRIKKIEIQAKVLSDHNPIEMELKGLEERTFRWRLNDNLWDDQKFVEKSQKNLTEFFRNNMDKGTRTSVVWDASKAVMRGLLIQQNVWKRNNREKWTKEILRQIMDYEQKLIKKPNNEKIRQEIKILQTQFAMTTNKEVEWNIKRLRQKNFEFANKPGKWLAWQVKKRKEQNTISKIEFNGEETTEPKAIRRAFVDYYKQLYRNKERNNKKKIERYLKDKMMRKIPTEEKKQLNAPIGKEEVEEAIKELKRGKAPGPDGFTSSYYKEMKDSLMVPLIKVMNNILIEKDIPGTWKEAFITIIPKQDSDLTQVKNYRPISLLNTDYKIFAGILAKRLKKILIKIIHKDQQGFLPGRQIKNNIRNIVNVIEYLSDRCDKPASLIFVDAEKAFDNVIWEFMLKNLKFMEVGQEFYNGIEAIYTDQKARLIVNNTITEDIKISKGTRQGCPLSPLLFIVVLEVLLNAIRQNKQIKGIMLGVNEYKSKAFADDVVLTVEEPTDSIKEILNEMEQFGELAGFRLNKKKTKMIVKNMDRDKIELLQQRTEIEVVKKIKYLGIWLSDKNIDLYQHNYIPVWKGVKRDLEIWARMKLSFWGRISMVKMMILPKLLFLFQTIPIIKGTKIFKEWQRAISRYVWEGKKPRIKFKLLTDLKERGGFALPDMRLYYEAACLCWIKEWVKLENTELLDLEGFNNKVGWHAYLWNDKKRVDKGFTNHIFKGALLEVWKRYKNILEPKIPHWLSPLEMMGIKKVNMREKWGNYGEMVCNEGGKWKLKPYDQIKALTYDWLHYFQINEMFKKELKERNYVVKESIFQKEIINNEYKNLSRMYKILLEWHTKDEEVKAVMVQWARDFGYNVQLEDWERLWKENIKFTACTLLRENMMKMLYRWYLSPTKLAKMYKVDNKCWKCKNKEGTFFHQWWECKKIKCFWEEIYNELKRMLKYTFVKKPEAFLLGIVGKDVRRRDHKLFQYAVTAARIVLAQKWKQEEVPTVEEWRAKLIEYAELDKLTGKIRYTKDQKFIKDWEKFVCYLENKYGVKTTLAGFKEAL